MVVVVVSVIVVVVVVVVLIDDKATSASIFSAHVSALGDFIRMTGWRRSSQVNLSGCSVNFSMNLTSSLQVSFGHARWLP